MKNDRITVLDHAMRESVGDEREIQWKFLVWLEEFDRLRGWGDYGSLWEYCRRRLGLLEGPANYRIRAMHVIREFPQAVDYLRDGRLWLTHLVVLKNVLTKDNVDEILDAAVGKSTDETDRYAKSWVPPIQAPPPLIRKMAVPAPLTRTEEIPQRDEASSVVAPSAVLQLMPRKGEVSPVASNQHLIRLFADDEFMTLLELATHIVSHSVPNGDVTLVVKRGLEEIVAKHERRLSPSRRHKINPWDPEQREIPEALWREVMVRDGEKCVWEFEAGGVCGSRWQVQVDHVIARALGGLTILPNLRVLCRKHNLEHARRAFGARLIDELIRRRGA